MSPELYERIFNLQSRAIPIDLILTMFSETEMVEPLPMSAKKRVLAYVEHHQGQTAAQIAKALNLKMTSVSALLNESTKADLIRRLPGVGPRGGYAYYSVNYQHPYPTRYDKIYFAKS